MSGRTLATLTLALALASDPAFAVLCHEDAPAAFTPGEQAIIDRNATLAVLAPRHPGLVRCALDAIAAAGASRSGADTPNGRRRKYERPPDPARNPDLDYLGRSSPEAAHDLFQLIKRASRGGKR